VDGSSEIDSEINAMLRVQFGELNEVAELRRDGSIDLIIV